jgi:hypothetical protein
VHYNFFSKESKAISLAIASCFLNILGYPQHSHIHNIVEIEQATSGSFKLEDKAFDSSIIRYYIHGDTVLRNDKAFMDFSVDKKPGKKDVFPITTMLLSKVPTNHMIDLRRNITSTVFMRDDTTYVELDSLKDNSFELIYNYPVNHRYTFKKVAETNKRKVKVFNRKCGLGYAISIKGDTVYFYYTKKSIPFASPLNRIIPEFPYSIMRIGLPATSAANRLYLNFTIVDMKQRELDEMVFYLPSSALTTWPKRSIIHK